MDNAGGPSRSDQLDLMLTYEQQAHARTKAERDAALVERDALLVRVDQWRQMADREATAHVEMRAERDAARQEAAAAQAAWASDVAEWKEWLLGAEQARDGWKQRAEQAEAALAEARLVLREVEPHLRFACNRYAENAYTRDEKAASGRAHDLKDALAAVLAQEAQ